MVNWSSVGTNWMSIGGSLASELELMIIRGELPRGEKIPPERELAATLGVSRTSLREALLELEFKGLVSRRPGRGTIVLESSTPAQSQQLLASFDAAQKDFQQIMEMRSAVEPGVAGLAALKATATDLRQLEALLETAEGENSASRLLELDVEFHTRVADIARNPLLSQLIRIVSEWASSSRRLGFQGPSRKDASLAGHRDILQALRRGDATAAEASMRHHLTLIHDLITPAVDADAASPPS